MTTFSKFDWPQDTMLAETHWRAVSEALAGNGVLNETDLAVSADTNTAMGIIVDAGSAFYNQAEHTLDTSDDHVLDSADPDNDRWDTVVFDTGTDSTSVHTGTAETYPTPPDIQDGEVLLAVVEVPASTSDVGDELVYNWRGAAARADWTFLPDSDGDYASDTVGGALTEDLDSARQLSSYPLSDSDLSDGSVTATELSDGSVTSTQIADGSVQDADVADDAAISRTKLDPQNEFTGRAQDEVAADGMQVVALDNLADTETLEVYKASLTTDLAEAVPSGVSLSIATFDNAGAYTTQQAVLSGDGATVHDRDTSGASWQNSTGSATTVGVIVENTTADPQGYVAQVYGATE